MFRHAFFAWCILFFTAAEAQAVVIRIDVTGGVFDDAIGVLGAGDPARPEFEVDPELTFAMIPVEQIPEWYLWLLHSRDGRAYFDGHFRRCSGLLRLLCHLDFERNDDGRNVPPIVFAYDVMRDTFRLSFPNYDEWGVEIDDDGNFFYSDSSYFFVRIGNVSYAVFGVSLYGSFDSVSVSAIPLPGGAALLLPALAGLALLRRGRRARGRG